MASPIVDLSIWLAWGGGLLLAAGLIVLICRALFRDRGTGKRRCPRCWHDLTGAPGLLCGECGHRARSERDLARTRRYWGRALLFLAVLVGGAMVVRVRVAQDGVWTYLPSRVLVALLPFSASGANVTDDLQLELLQRTGRGELSSSLERKLVEIVLAGDAAALPVTPAWENRYGRFVAALFHSARTGAKPDMTTSETLGALRSLPPKLTLTPASPSPRDRPLMLELELREWWPPDTQARVRIRDLADDTEATRGLNADTNPAITTPLFFAPPRDGETEREFEVSVESRAAPTAEDPDPAWSQRTSERIAVPVVGCEELPLLPSTDDALGDAIQSAFSAGFVVWKAGERRFGLRYEPQRTADRAFDGAIVGVEVALLEGDVVRRRSRLWWPAGRTAGGGGWEISEEDVEGLARLDELGTGELGSSDPDAADTWSLRVTGLPEIAARALRAPPSSPVAGNAPDASADGAVPLGPDGRALPTTYWSGTRTIPLTVEHLPGPAPRRRWFRFPD